MPLTAQGYVALTVADYVAALNTAVLTNVDGGLDLDPDQPLGQLIGIVAETYAELDEAVATIYNMLNPAAAEGNFLDNLAAISGTKRTVAQYAKVTAQATLNASTTLSAGAVASVANQPANRWVLMADITNSGGSPAAISGVWRSETPGAFVANASTLTVIATPSIGWTAINNTDASTGGSDTETDTELRITRDAELAGEGSSDIDAIRAKVLAVVTAAYPAGNVFVFENDTLVTDANGLPGKAFRVVVWDNNLAANVDIANAIWTAKPAGILAYGGTAVNITDSSGNTQTVSFDRATTKRLYVSCTTTPSSLTTTQQTAVKNAIVAYAAATFNLGVSVIARSFSASPLEPTATYTPFVTDVPVFEFDFTPSPTNTGNLAVTGLQIVQLAFADVLVNGS
jgi:uncharacterized phage protein gp47/JayE